MTAIPAIIYDGECRFCQWSVRRIRKLDRRRQFEFAPRQTEGLDQRFPVLTESDFNTGLRLIDAEAVYVGADAIYQIYRHLPPHNLVAWLYRVPPFTQLARLGYAIIARNRHRFGLVEWSVNLTLKRYPSLNFKPPVSGDKCCRFSIS